MPINSVVWCGVFLISTSISYTKRVSKKYNKVMRCFFRYYKRDHNTRRHRLFAACEDFFRALRYTFPNHLITCIWTPMRRSFWVNLPDPFQPCFSTSTLFSGGVELRTNRAEIGGNSLQTCNVLHHYLDCLFYTKQ